jgi:hypothetical protein
MDSVQHNSFRFILEQRCHKFLQNHEILSYCFDTILCWTDQFVEASLVPFATRQRECSVLFSFVSSIHLAISDNEFIYWSLPNVSIVFVIGIVSMRIVKRIFMFVVKISRMDVTWPRTEHLDLLRPYWNLLLMTLPEMAEEGSSETSVCS